MMEQPSPARRVWVERRDEERTPQAESSYTTTSQRARQGKSSRPSAKARFSGGKVRPMDVKVGDRIMSANSPAQAGKIEGHRVPRDA